MVTDRQTHTQTQTNAGKNILPRFRGENKYLCVSNSNPHRTSNRNCTYSVYFPRT